MDNFFIIIPFLIPLWVMYITYKQYQDKKAGRLQRRTSRFEKYEWYRYLRIIYVERGVVKFWSAIWYIPLLFCSVFGVISILGYFQDSIFPPIPLKQMQTKMGTISSIQLRKKMDDLLILKTDKDETLTYSIRSTKKEAKRLFHKKVKIWYTKGWSSTFSIDNIIYQVRIDGRKTSKYPYDYQHHLSTDKSFLNFGIICIYITLFSLFIIWIQNRKEKPYHRLYRLKRYKKLQKLKEEK